MPNYCTIEDLRQRIGVHVPKLRPSKPGCWENLPPDVQTLIAKIIELDPSGRPYFVRYWSDAGSKEKHWQAFLNVHLRDLDAWNVDRANAALGKAVELGLAARPNPTGGAQFIEKKLVFGDYVYLTEEAHEAWRRAGEPKPKLGAAGGGNPIEKKKRGRRVDTDPKFDKWCYDAWKTGCHSTYAVCAQALGMTEREFKLAFDRHEKRLTKQRCQAL